ncbi:MAG: hypothetical protein Q8S21_04860 [Candidatus Paracaedibacteraceae bacterium]|nr:hypothetical protein [Candidatus Paracaedibacteraceae bacterium]
MNNKSRSFLFQFKIIKNFIVFLLLNSFNSYMSCASDELICEDEQINFSNYISNLRKKALGSLEEADFANPESIASKFNELESACYFSSEEDKRQGSLLVVIEALNEFSDQYFSHDYIECIKKNFLLIFEGCPDSDLFRLNKKHFTNEKDKNNILTKIANLDEMQHLEENWQKWSVCKKIATYFGDENAKDRLYEQIKSKDEIAFGEHNNHSEAVFEGHIKDMYEKQIQFAKDYILRREYTLDGKTFDRSSSLANTLEKT